MRKNSLAHMPIRNVCQSAEIPGVIFILISKKCLNTCAKTVPPAKKLILVSEVLANVIYMLPQMHHLPESKKVAG